MVSHLKTIPQFEEVGMASDEGNVWARLKTDECLFSPQPQTYSQYQSG
jgi:hypothetical protein